jgi:hypothetical protein
MSHGGARPWRWEREHRTYALRGYGCTGGFLPGLGSWPHLLGVRANLEGVTSGAEIRCSRTICRETALRVC